MLFDVFESRRKKRFQINVIAIKQITWNGDNYEFRMDTRFGPNAAYTFEVKGSVTP